ncbi:hypothetical protein QBC34DRAFT_383613 [Podospora aff. communis PSN243]|uniref:Uncharacterized protein n=1 Tax=Podospora aff. communis PSN243 TaxID=3040156 RepID=A0AAV9GDL6_9PEZI|nr:hypothetical protein QBC34DRAFT_383613 [Podospora aff. communis PSN243]
MKFLTVVAALASLAAAAPAPGPSAVEERQVLLDTNCTAGMKNGEYRCYGVPNNPKSFMYIAQCNNNKLHVISWCNCKTIGGNPYCV